VFQGSSASGLCNLETLKPKIKPAPDDPRGSEFKARFVPYPKNPRILVLN